MEDFIKVVEGGSLELDLEIVDGKFASLQTRKFFLVYSWGFLDCKRRVLELEVSK